MALEKEMETYRKLVGDHDHAQEHHGQYTLIQGEDVVGFFSSFDDALREGYRQFKPGSFLVKQVSTIEEVPFVSRFIQPRRSLPAKRMPSGQS